jgi:pyruvate kinase
MRHPERRSKIVCTIGPAVASYESIYHLIERGMDVARLNFSHGTHEQHRQAIQWIREASRKLQIPVAILGDLQGPKIRTSKLLQAPLPLKAEQEVSFFGFEVGQTVAAGDGSVEKPIGISYPRLVHDLRKGDSLLFDDGLIRMSVKSVQVDQNILTAVVEHGRTLGENKGVNMPGARLSASGITEKDWDDILFATREDFDFLALSFVRSSREIKSLKGFLEQKKLGIHVIAKIEKAEAIENIDDILFHSDGIMVARGDLGVEIGNEKVPIIQKKLIQRARAAAKPVITATQMLMSMVDSPSPSRAEASDVANAVLDGTDALMLSNETATGKYPFESVSTMSNIILGAETITARDYLDPGLMPLLGSGRKLHVSEGIEAASTSLATSLHARCLACLTRSGQAARLLAKHRPHIPIFAFAESERTRNQLSLTWGVSVIPWKEVKAQDYTIFDDLMNALGRLGLIKDGDLAVMTAGIPTSFQVGTTNTIVVKSYPPPRRAE